LSRDALPRFEQALQAQVARVLDPAWLQAEVLSDGELQPHEFDATHARMLRDGGPWGQGYPEPLFDGCFDVLAWRVVGERHLKLELGSGLLRLAAIEFGGWDGQPPPSRVRVAYRLEPDAYRGGDAVQLVVVHREPA
jgi:single-stranded-DNA-specific exonuclease